MTTMGYYFTKKEKEMVDEWIRLNATPWDIAVSAAERINNFCVWVNTNGNEDFKKMLAPFMVENFMHFDLSITEAFCGLVKNTTDIELYKPDNAPFAFFPISYEPHDIEVEE